MLLGKKGRVTPWIAQQAHNLKAISTMPNSKKKPRYFERPDPNEKPLSFWESLVIVLSSHLGVRSAEKRQEDFRRANGLHLLIVGIVYFAAVIIGLIVLVRFITR